MISLVFCEDCGEATEGHGKTCLICDTLLCVSCQREHGLGFCPEIEHINNNIGKCSVPMWMYPGLPAGFCGKPAYGKRPECEQYRNPCTNEMQRRDGRYNGYVPDLACSEHGGPEQKEVAHKGDPCMYCNIPHDDVPSGPCRARMAKTP